MSESLARNRPIIRYYGSYFRAVHKGRASESVDKKVRPYIPTKGSGGVPTQCTPVRPSTAVMPVMIPAPATDAIALAHRLRVCSMNSSAGCGFVQGNYKNAVQQGASSRSTPQRKNTALVPGYESWHTPARVPSTRSPNFPR